MVKKPEQMELPTFPGGRSIMMPDGSEVLDPRPMALPVGFEKPETIQETIRRLVLDPQIRADLQASDMETFDEADDFEEDDGMPVTPHEENFDPMHLLSREQEVMSGLVRPRSREEVQAAQDFIKKQAEALKKPEPVSTPSTPSPKGQ